MGPKDVEDIEDITIADGGGESVPATSRRDRGKAPGKKTLVEQRYGPLRPGKAAENAHMDVEAFESPESSTPVDSWRGDTFFHVESNHEPRAHFTADKHKGRWRWSDPAGATLKVNSDAEGRSGQSLSEWAPARASYMDVDIEPLAPSAGRPDDVLHGHGPIELDPERITLEDTERLAAGLDPSTRAAALIFFDSPAVDAATSEREVARASAQGHRSAGSGSAERNDGKGDTSRPGKRKEMANEHA